MKKCCFCGNEKESELHANKGYGGSYAYFCANVDDCWKRIQNNKSAQQRLHLTAIAACGLGVVVGLCIGWLWFGA